MPWIAELVTEVAILAEGKRTYKRENGELKAEVARLHEACVKGEYDTCSTLEKAIGVEPSGMMALEIAEMLVRQDKFRVQRKETCSECKGNGHIKYLGKEIPELSHCHKCDGEGFTWQTVEVK